MARIDLSKLTATAYEEGRRLVAPLLGLPGVRLSGTNVKLAQQNASEHFKVIKKIVDTFSPDISFPLMDLSVEANALARYTIIPVNDTATVPKTDFTLDEIDKLRTIDISYDSRLNSCVETMRLLRIGLPDGIIRAAYVIGPYSLSALIMGAQDAAIAILDCPQEFHKLCTLATETIHEYIGMLIRAKADPIVILEPTAVMLGPVQFQEFSANYVKHLVDSYRDVNLVYHTCGNTMHLVEKMAESGIRGISLDSREHGVDLLEVTGRVPEDVVLIGNISTTGTLYRGTPDEVRDEVFSLLRSMDPYPNYMLSSACDIPQETPVENIHAFMSAGRDYRIKN
jgi:uroporphyrinogen decarboxylase